LSDYIIPRPSPRSGGDDDARREGSSLSYGKDLENLANATQHGRREGVRDLIARCLKVVICVGVLIFLAGALIWSWHILGWTCKWLSPKDLASIQKGIGQVGIGALFGFLIKSKFL
jgi:hypothetical protein